MAPVDYTENLMLTAIASSLNVSTASYNPNCLLLQGPDAELGRLRRDRRLRSI